MNASMSESQAQLPRVTFRFSDDLRARLEKAAKTNKRSVNAEVVARLEATFERDEFLESLPDDIAGHEERIANLERRMDDVFHMAGWRDYPENQSD